MKKNPEKYGERMAIDIRRASLRDEADLVELCEAAVGPDDYVIQALDDALLKNTVMIALDESERIVGMISLVESIDGCGWLGMARTHPDARRHGVAGSLIQRIIGLAKGSNMPFLRLWTDHDNVSAKATAESLGFREVSQFMRVNAPKFGGKLKAKRLDFSETLWSAVDESPAIAMGAGYLCYDWCFVRASRSVLAAIGAQGRLYGWKDNLLTFSPEHDRFTRELEFTALAGNPPSVFEEARREADALGCEKANTFIPNKRKMIFEAKKSGYVLGHWGRAAILYELAVTE